MYVSGGDSLKDIESVPVFGDESIADESALATIGPGIPGAGESALAGVTRRGPAVGLLPHQDLATATDADAIIFLDM